MHLVIAVLYVTLRTALPYKLATHSSDSELANGSDCLRNNDCASGCCLFLRLRPFSGTCIAQALPGQVCGSIVPPLVKARHRLQAMLNIKYFQPLHNQKDAALGHNCLGCTSGCCCGSQCCPQTNCGGTQSHFPNRGRVHRTKPQPSQIMFSYGKIKQPIRFYWFTIYVNFILSPISYGTSRSDITGKWCSRCFTLCCCAAKCCNVQQCTRHAKHKSQTGLRTHFPPTKVSSYYPYNYGGMPATPMIPGQLQSPLQQNPYISGYDQLMALLLLAQLQHRQPAAVMTSQATQSLPQSSMQIVLSNGPNFTLPEHQSAQVPQNSNLNSKPTRTQILYPGNRIMPIGDRRTAYPDLINVNQKFTNSEIHNMNQENPTIVYPEPPIIVYAEKEMGSAIYPTDENFDISSPQKGVVLQSIDMSEMTQSLRQQLRPFSYKDSPIINEEPQSLNNHRISLHYKLANNSTV